MADNVNVRINKGTVFKIVAGAPATYDEAGYTTLLAAAPEVGEIHDYGTYGGTRNIATHTPVKTQEIKKRAGSLDFGQLSIAFGQDVTDAGQIALSGFFASGEVVSCSIVDGAGAEYFTGVVSDNQVTRGDADTIITQAGTVDLSFYLPVPA